MSNKISIGILAYNESQVIEKTLNSLFQQTIFDSKNLDLDYTIEIVIVPNGCTDNTFELSKLLLNDFAVKTGFKNFIGKVSNVEKAGKSNAWNLYIHEFSSSEAKYIFLMDADIEFVEKETLANMIECLESNSEVWIAVDSPMKNVIFKQKKNILDKLSILGSKEYNNSICGQLYCGRSSILKQIWMPPGLSIEDGFLRAMIVTNLFRSSSEVPERIQTVPNSSHIFKAYTNIFEWIHHEQRMLIGNTVNSILYSYLWANCHENNDAGSLIKLNNERNALWFKELIENTFKSRWFVISPNFIIRRWLNFKTQPLTKKLVKITLNIIALIPDIIIYYRANDFMRKGKGIGYW